MFSGVDGEKVWLEANETGQEIEFTVHATGNTIALEYYEHDTLKMGVIEANIELEPWSPQASSDDKKSVSKVIE